jgi:YebC/PmpR family DNA-binding regulatory protein
MAGHSKWKQIKHRKAAKDGKRANVFGKLSKAITVEVKTAGGDTEAPNVLAMVERAKAVDMPKENIERALQKGAGVGETELIPLLFETFGPGGVPMLITTITDSRNRTVQEIKHLLTKHDTALGTQGSSLWAFTKTQEGYEPTNPIELADEDAEKLSELVDALEDTDDVQNVFVATN